MPFEIKVVHIRSFNSRISLVCLQQKIEQKVKRYIRKYVMLAPKRVGRAGPSVGVRRLPSLCLEKCVEGYSPHIWRSEFVSPCYLFIFFVFNIFFPRKWLPHRPTSRFQVPFLGLTFLSRDSRESQFVFETESNTNLELVILARLMVRELKESTYFSPLVIDNTIRTSISQVCVCALIKTHTHAYIQTYIHTYYTQKYF